MKLAEDIEAAVAGARAKVQFGFPWWLRPFLMTNVAAITLGRRIWVSPALAARPDRRAVEKLIRHELAHVRQFARLGLPLFLYRYLAEYVQLRRSGLSSDAAYNAISFEREAFAAEEAEHV